MDAARKRAILEKLGENKSKKPKVDKYRIPKAVGTAALGTALGATGGVLGARGIKALSIKFPKFRAAGTKYKGLWVPVLSALGGHLSTKADRLFREQTMKKGK